MSVPETDVRFCRACGEVLNVLQHGTGGPREYLHSGQRPGRPYAHRAEAVRLEDLGRAPVIRCDICTTGVGAWVYLSDDQQAYQNAILRQDVGQRDYASRHGAARARRTITERRQTQNIGDRWSACIDCATLIEARDLLALISRGIDGQTRRFSGKLLIRMRGELHGLYEYFLDTLKPGRGAITPEHPFGVWPDPSTSPAAPMAAPAVITPTHATTAHPAAPTGLPATVAPNQAGTGTPAGPDSTSDRK
jgi:hypothetical protein